MAGLLKKLFSADAPQRETPSLASDLPPLSDSDFEFLLDQLIQGLAHGWQPDRVETFMLDLGQRGKAPAWETWLANFSTRILTQTQRPQQRQLGTRLLYISDALNHSPKLQRHSRAFAQYGQQLVTGQQQQAEVDLIWEYDGEDVLTPTPVAPNPDTVTQISSPQTVIQPTEPQPPTEPIAVESSPEISATETAPAVSPEPAPEPTPEPVPEPSLSKAQLEEMFARGLTKADQGDFEGAIADWDEVLKINPQIPQVWHNRGSAFGCLGQFEAALACFDQALEIAPTSVVAWKDRSYALMKLEQWQAALESWNRTIELRDNVAEAWFQRGATLERLGKYDNAQINYRKAIALEPDFEQAQLRLEVLQAGNPNPTPSQPPNPDPWSEA